MTAAQPTTWIVLRPAEAVRVLAGNVSAQQPVPIPLPPAPSASSAPTQSLDNFFHRAPELPSVEARINLVLSTIDWTAPTFTIWVPGTSEYWIKQTFLDEMRRLAPGSDLTMIPYLASWQFSSSVPDGSKVLRGVLEGIARRAPGQPILLAGESQGAWVISAVLTDPAMAALATRTAIWGHPGAAPQTFGRPGAVRERNNPADIVAADLGKNTVKIMGAVEMLARRNFGHGLARMAAYAVQRPDILKKLLNFWKINLTRDDRQNPHRYEDDFAAGVEYLLGGLSASVLEAIRKRRASKT